MATPALAIALLASSAASYERDKSISDIEEPPFRPTVVEHRTATAGTVSIGRVPTEDLIMHCRDESGHWHRLHPSKLQTACGLPYMNWNASNRRSGRHPTNPLASCDCWTKAERAEADEMDRLGASAVPQE